MRRKQFICSTLALLATAAAHAQPAFPTKPIRMIVPFPPGGGTDFLARTVATKLAEATGWTIVADNRAGAGGTIGIAETAKAEPTGYTLVMAQVDNLAVAPLLYKNLSYHPVRDVQPVAQVADFSIIQCRGQQDAAVAGPKGHRGRPGRRGAADHARGTGRAAAGGHCQVARRDHGCQHPARMRHGAGQPPRHGFRFAIVRRCAP